ncbi:MAG: tRNA (guanosine(37)-N1)-methyltransferase TrmD [Rhodospirillales bacterium]|nr:tRNA (guanosine(37)-N1)-methyltransferase TrmD [Rhodospirillales bacterium]
MAWTAHVLTLFPEVFPGPLGASLAGAGLDKGLWTLSVTDIRNFATNRHRSVDDTPYGGGGGMVLRPDVVDAALETAKRAQPAAKAVYLTPRGRPLCQDLARALVAAEGLILLCGRYEGVDERVLEKHALSEVSVGDYVLSGGELAAMVVVDSVVRLLPGVMGNAASPKEESFGSGFGGLLLEHPHYTRPAVWQGRAVPAELQNGHHAEIRAWRRRQAEAMTQARRPDLWRVYSGEDDTGGRET